MSFSQQTSYPSSCRLCLFLLGVLCLAWSSSGQRPEDSESKATLERVLRAMDLALDFMDTEHERLNLDAVIGTRIAEGQLAVLIRNLESPGGTNVGSDMLAKIREVQKKADHVSDIAVAVVKQSQPQYYKHIGAILGKGFWSLDYASRDVDPSRAITPRVDGEAMHEEDSDNCLAELFGTTGKTKQTCKVSRHCWKLMTQAGYREYSLTHEVFYLEIGQSFGCFTGNLLSYIDRLNSGFCANILAEAEKLVLRNYPSTHRDLFMEQAALCGMLGYRQFFREDWLNTILSWQRQPRGCWGVEAQPSQAHEAKGRTKREERVLADGCQCHRTAVALGALSQYVRYIVEYSSNAI